MSQLTYDEIKQQLGTPVLYGKIETLKKMKKDYEALRTPILKVAKEGEIAAKKREIETIIAKARATILKFMKGKSGDEWKRLNRLNTLYAEVSDRLDEFSTSDSMSVPNESAAAAPPSATVTNLSLAGNTVSLAPNESAAAAPPSATVSLAPNVSSGAPLIVANANIPQSPPSTSVTGSTSMFGWGRRKPTGPATMTDPVTGGTGASMFGLGRSRLAGSDPSMLGLGDPAPANPCKPTLAQIAAVRSARDAMDALLDAMDPAPVSLLTASRRGGLSSLRGGNRKSRKQTGRHARKTQRRK